ncbi:MAG: PQQ-binding-like beta-propeller repeat protein [Planctomycetaceae bacterium]|nr:PQQ-binding-like beta-propeller repeat protein [Planctomycetales bacterium]MCB9926856.1 PQQ-binding-like beta-propeller repeat protein [Planctomycetaceae bacterium]
MNRFILNFARINLVLLLGTICSAQEWTRFRGPNGSGISDAKTIPTSWTENDYNWIAELPGRGHSSPVVWGDKLFVTCCDDAASLRYLVCLNTSDGSVFWTKSFPFETYKQQKNNSFASSTPTVDAEHVYVLWHSRQSSPLIAMDHEGNQVWEYDLGPYTHGQGGATSPIVVDDFVVVAHDQKVPSFLLALDRRTGKEHWKIPREGRHACYATPCVNASSSRPPELVFSHCYEGIIGVDLETGKQNWHIDPFGRDDQRSLVSPIIAGDLVIAGSGAAGGTRHIVAVSLEQSGSTTAAAEAYHITRQAPHIPTPLAYGPWLFLWSDQGIATCLDRATGKIVWQQRIGGNFYSSPICVDGRIYCIDLDGVMVVIAAADKYEELSRVTLGHPTSATPAVSDGIMFIRTESHVFSLGGAK